VIVKVHIQGTDESVMRRFKSITEAMPKTADLEFSLEVTESTQEMLQRAAQSMAALDYTPPEPEPACYEGFGTVTLDHSDEDAEVRVFIGERGLLPEVARAMAQDILAKADEYERQEEDERKAAADKEAHDLFIQRGGSFTADAEEHH